MYFDDRDSRVYTKVSPEFIDSLLIQSRISGFDVPDCENRCGCRSSITENDIGPHAAIQTVSDQTADAETLFDAVLANSRQIKSANRGGGRRMDCCPVSRSRTVTETFNDLLDDVDEHIRLSIDSRISCIVLTDDNNAAASSIPPSVGTS